MSMAHSPAPSAARHPDWCASAEWCGGTHTNPWHRTAPVAVSCNTIDDRHALVSLARSDEMTPGMETAGQLTVRLDLIAVFPDAPDPDAAVDAFLSPDEAEDLATALWNAVRQARTLAGSGA